MIFGSVRKGNTTIQIEVDCLKNVSIKTFGELTLTQRKKIDLIDTTESPLKVLTEATKIFHK